LSTPTVPGTYFNTAAFTDPAGSLGRTAILALRQRWPQFAQWPGVRKREPLFIQGVFQIKESFKLQTRLEAFNATNTPHFASPNSDFKTKSNFGEITRTSGDMRIVQLAVKFIF